MTEQDWNKAGNRLLTQDFIFSLLENKQNVSKSITKSDFTKIKKAIVRFFQNEVEVRFFGKLEKLAVMWENNENWFELSIEKEQNQHRLIFAKGNNGS